MDEYEVEINGMTTTLQLTAADAEARGLKKKAASKSAKAPADKAAAAPANKGGSAAASKA